MKEYIILLGGSLGELFGENEGASGGVDGNVSHGGFPSFFFFRRFCVPRCGYIITKTAMTSRPFPNGFQRKKLSVPLDNFSIRITYFIYYINMYNHLYRISLLDFSNFFRRMSFNFFYIHNHKKSLAKNLI